MANVSPAYAFMANINRAVFHAMEAKYVFITSGRHAVPPVVVVIYASMASGKHAASNAAEAKCANTRFEG
jgi:hypothetical protein